ncbi:MAG: hypothetical protein AAFY29_22035 [Pseudomonadota bacterium]
MRKGLALLIMIGFALAALLGVNQAEEKNDKFSVFEFERYIIKNDFVVALDEQQIAEYNEAARGSLDLLSEDWKNQNIIIPLINPLSNFRSLII